MDTPPGGSEIQLGLCIHFLPIMDTLQVIMSHSPDYVSILMPVVSPVSSLVGGDSGWFVYATSLILSLSL